MNKLVLVLAIFTLLLGCRKENVERVGVVIKGTISGTGTLKSSRLKSDNSFSLADAKKVLVFYGTRYSLADVIDGSFTAYAEMGSATALVFLDVDNKYIGNLFTGGLNVLPLGDLKDGENTIIDLQSLSLDSTSVIPSHNPIGDEINLTEEEVTRFREMGGYFESLAKNIDADNDGIPDILSNKQLYISSQFTIYGGRWGTDNTQPSQIDTSQFFINYAVRISGNISMAPANGNSVALSGPEGDMYNDIFKASYNADKDCFISFFRRNAQASPNAPWGSAFLPFKMGTYAFTLTGSDSYSLNYSNINAKYYMVIATPTLHADNVGNITSVTIEYKLPDNTIVNPANFLTNLQLQFIGNSNQNIEIGGLYESVKTNLTITDLTNIAVNATINLSSLQQLNVNYNDLLGNEYDVIWR